MRITLAIVSLFLAVSIVGYIVMLRYIDNYATSYEVTLDTAPEADAVVVLGARVYDDGTPSPILGDRLLYAYTLYKTGKAPKIIVSGDHGTKHYDEVNAMRRWLLARGVPEDDIFMDHAGFNTYDSMVRAREVFGAKKLLISTQRFHMARSLYIARRLGIDAYGCVSEDKEIYKMSHLKCREIFAKGRAFLDVEIVKRSPKYLGEPIPVSGSGIATVD